MNHEILLQKLLCYGIRGKAFQWISCYLTNCLQYVSIGNIQSTKGVVYHMQGSVLGPLLFLLYINDIHLSVPNFKLKLFPEDTNLFTSGKKLDELVKETNFALNNLNIWFRANKLSLSIDKTSFSFFNPNNGNLNDNGNELILNLIINDSVIKRVNCCKYLECTLMKNCHG